MTKTIAQAVEQIRNTLSQSNLDESATKQGVVLRLLSLAGWDIFNVSEVVSEHTVGGRRVDYALIPGSHNTVFIEVKRSGENLEGHQQQLLEYCFQEGVKLAALTNGRTWWLYLPLQAGSWEQRRFLTIDLESQESHTVEQRFIEYLSADRVTGGQAVSAAEGLVQSQQRADLASKAIVEAWNQIVETPDEILLDLISETTERICGFKPEPGLVEQFLLQHIRALPHPPATQKNQAKQQPVAGPKPTPVESLAIEPSSVVNIAGPRQIEGKSLRPISLEFQGRFRQLNSWNDVLIQLCELLNELHPQDFDQVLTIRRSHRLNSKWPFHFSQNPSDLRKPKKIRNSGIYAEVDLTATALVDLCYQLVQLFGYSQKSLVIQSR